MKSKQATIIKELVELHNYWHQNDSNDQQFNYMYIRNIDPALISAIEYKKYKFKGIHKAFELAGINPLCHLTGILYGRSVSDVRKKKNFQKVLYRLALDVNGYENLNDNNVNSSKELSLPFNFLTDKPFHVCEKAKCHVLPISYRSIYARGRAIYGTWKNALIHAGFNYKNIRRKKPKYTRDEVMKDFLNFVNAQSSKWTIKELRQSNLSLYKGIYNSHENSPFKFTNRPVMEVAYMELSYLLRKENEPDLTPENFYFEGK